MNVHPYQLLPSEKVNWEQRRWNLATRFAVQLGGSLIREEKVQRMTFLAAINMADLFITEYTENIIEKACDQMAKDCISEETATKMNEQLEKMRKAIEENAEVYRKNRPDGDYLGIDNTTE